MATDKGLKLRLANDVATLINVIHDVAVKAHGSTYAKLSVKGHNVLIRCPFHIEDKPSFHMHQDKPMAKCFGCNVFFTNPAAVLKKARIQQYITDDEFWEITKKYNLDDKCLKAGGIKTYHKNEVRLLDFFRELNTEFILQFQENITSKNKKYLEETRQFDLQFLGRTEMIGQVPHVSEIIELADALKIPKSFKTSIINTFSYHEGKLAFPIQLPSGEVIGFLLRGTNKGDMAQVYISALFNKPSIPAGGFIGIKSLTNHHMDCVLPKGTTSALMVEGPFDVLRVLDLVQYTNTPILPLAYKHSTGRDQVSELADLGIQTLYYIPDNDPHNYADISPGVSNVLNSFPMTMTGYILSLNFMKGHGVKDIDELIQRSGNTEQSKDLIGKMLFSETESKFLPISEFLVEEVFKEEEMGVPVIAEVGKKLIKSLANPTYVIQALSSLGRDDLKTTISDLNYSVAEHIDDILTHQILEFLTTKYTFIFKEVDIKTSQTMIYFLHNGHVTSVLLEARGIETFVINHEGDIILWFEKNFNTRDVLRSTEKQKLLSDTIIKRIIDLTRRAFAMIVVDLPHKGSYQVKTHGVHRTAEADTLLLVNGGNYFRIIYDFSEAGGFPNIEKISIPIVDGVIIDTEKTKEILPGRLVDPAEFRKVTLADYEQVFKNIQDMVSCWSWGGDHFVTLITGYLCTIWVQVMFPYTMSPFFTAEKQSGKTKFLGLLTGDQLGKALLPGSMAISDASAAGLRSIVQSSTIPVFLDEFEPRNKKYEELLAFLRSLTTGGGKTIRGTQTGEYLEYNYKTPVGLAAINTLQGDADNSRFTYLPLQHETNHDDPHDLIALKLKGDYLKTIEQTSYMNIVCSIRFLPELREAYQATKDMISELRQEFGLPTRASMNMCLPLAMVRLILGAAQSKQCFLAYLNDDKIIALSQFNKVGREIDEILEFLVSGELFINTVDSAGNIVYKSLYHYLEKGIALEHLDSLYNCVCVFKYEGSLYMAVKWTMLQVFLSKSHYKPKHVVTLDTIFMNASLDLSINQKFITDARAAVQHFNTFYNRFLTRGTKFSIIDISSKTGSFSNFVGNTKMELTGEEESLLD